MHSINARYYFTIATYAVEEQRIKARKKGRLCDTYPLEKKEIV